MQKHQGVKRKTTGRESTGKGSRLNTTGEREGVSKTLAEGRRKVG